jgi:hypothetical protein
MAPAYSEAAVIVKRRMFLTADGRPWTTMGNGSAKADLVEMLLKMWLPALRESGAEADTLQTLRDIERLAAL